MPLAVVLITALTAAVLVGIRRSNATNTAIVTITLASLAPFVLAGLPSLVERGAAAFAPFMDPAPGCGGLPALLYASALIFFAYTGYGRIATLGEEVRDPARTIPRRGGVAAGCDGSVRRGGDRLGRHAGTDALSAVEARTAPLETAARGFGVPFAPQVLAIGAVTAMVGVLLNLIVGLSRVLLATGRRRDVPAVFGHVNEAGTTPVPAVIAVGLLIIGLALLGDVRVTWSFSAFTVLVYYAITNLAALRLPPEMRRFPRWVSVAGLASCLTLAIFVDPPALAVRAGLLAAALVWHEVARRVRG